MAGSAKPVDRIETRPLDIDVTMASTTGHRSGGRSPLRWFETLKCYRQCKGRGMM